MNDSIKKILIGFGAGLLFTTIALCSIYIWIIGPRTARSLYEARATVSSLTEKVSSLSGEAENLRSELQKNLRDLDAANAKFARSSAELADLSRRFAEAQDRARKYAASLEDFRKRYGDSLARIEELEARVRSITGDVSVYFEQIRSSLDRLSRADTTISATDRGLQEIVDIIQQTLTGD